MKQQRKKKGEKQTILQESGAVRRILRTRLDVRALGGGGARKDATEPQM